MENRKTILLVEDDPEIMKTNTYIFKSEGYSMLTAGTLAEALSHLDNASPDVIVLDLKLPDGNALDILPEIKKRTAAPILMLTAMVEKEERLAGLRAGGDDYITKPYDIDELCARVAAFIRREEMRKKMPPSDTFTHATITLDIVIGQAYVDGESMELTQKEFAMLRLFAKNEDKILTKEFIYETIWKQEMFEDDKSVRNTISKLRKKLETSRSGYDIVATKGKGYTFIEG